jgi:glycosyltransferase involved in cell wall biosynthesis
MTQGTLPQSSEVATDSLTAPAEDASTGAPLRVLHVESGHEWRYTRNQVSLLVEGLSHCSRVQQAVAGLARSRLTVEIERMGIPVIALPWAVGSDPRALRTLAREARRGWDIFHAHDSHALRLLIYLGALEGSAGRIVASHRVPGRPRSAWKWKRADLVLSTSQSKRDSLLDAGIERGRVLVVPNGVDDSDFEPMRPGGLREASGAGPEHFLIGSLAALAKDRDHATLVRAAALVTARYPAARFALFGEGGQRRGLENLIDSLDLGGKVCLPGYIEGARYSLADLDLFVMPSLGEEMSTGCLEAMWAGLPVVMTSEGDGRLRAEGIEPVRSRDHAEMARVIGRFIEEPGYRQGMAHRSKRGAAAHGAGRMVRLTVGAYDTALTAPKR